LRILDLYRCGLLAGILFTPRLASAQLVFELARRANSADSSGNYTEATRLWRQAYSVNGGEPGPLLAAAQSATRAGDHKAAFGALRQAIDEGFRIPVGALEADSSLRLLHDDTRWSALVSHARRLASERDTALAAELLSLGSAISGTAIRLARLSGGVEWDHQKRRPQTARLLQRMLLSRRA
jgi:hypothetical protein